MKRILVMLFAVALVLNSNAQEVSATYDPDVDGGLGKSAYKTAYIFVKSPTIFGTLFLM